MLKNKLLVTCFLFLAFFDSRGQIQQWVDSLATIHDDSARIQIMGRIANEYVFVNPSESFEFALKTLKLADSLQWEWGRALGYRVIANSYIGMDNYSLSFENINKSYQLYQELQDPLGIGNCLVTLGWVSFLQDRYKESFQYHNQAVEIFENIRNPIRLGVALNNAGNSLNFVGNYDSALIYLFRAAEINEKEGNFGVLTATFKNIGHSYLLKNEYTKAFHYFTKTDSMGNVLNEFYNKEAIVDSKLLLGDHYLIQNNEEKALELYLEAVSITEAYKVSRKLRDVYEKLASFFEQTGNFEKAVYYFRLNKHIEDSIGQYKIYYNKATIEYENEIHQVKEELSTLQESAAINELQLKNRSTVLYGVLVILGILILGIVIIVRMANSRKKINTQLKRQNTEILNKNKVIEEQKYSLEEVNEELKLQSEKVENINNKLVSVNNDLLNFSQLLSKELKDPLRGISFLASSLLEDEQENLSEDVKETLLLLQVQTRRMNNFVNEISEVNKTINRPLSVTLFDPVQVFVDEASYFNQLVPISIELPEMNAVNTDPGGFKSLIHYLIKSSILLNNRDTIEIKVFNNVTEHNYEFLIKDNGKFVSEGELKILLETFNTQKGKSDAITTGMELAICNKIVQFLEGKLEVMSSKDEGNTFRVILPIKTAIS